MNKIIQIAPATPRFTQIIRACESDSVCLYGLTADGQVWAWEDFGGWRQCAEVWVDEPTPN